jgi:hypothetical protein
MDDQYVEIYVEAFEKWKLLANVSSWREWSDGIFARPKCYIYPKTVADLYELQGWIIAMDYRWPNSFPDIQAAFQEFRITLQHFLRVFHEWFYRSDEEGFYWHEKIEFYIPGLNPSIDEQNWIDYHNGPGGWIEDFMVELTAAANFIVKLYNLNIGSHLGIHEPKIEISYLGGPRGPAATYFPELDYDQEKDIVNQWFIADRVGQIAVGPRRFMQPDFLPLKHREDWLSYDMTDLQNSKKYPYDVD